MSGITIKYDASYALMILEKSIPQEKYKSIEFDMEYQLQRAFNEGRILQIENPKLKRQGLKE